MVINDIKFNPQSLRLRCSLEKTLKEWFSASNFLWFGILERIVSLASKHFCEVVDYHGLS